MARKLTRRHFLKATGATLAGLGLAGCARTTPTPAAPASIVRILWTGDSHGQLLPVYHREFYDESYLSQYSLQPGSVEAYITSNVDYLNLARQYGKVGGFAHLATLVKQERAAYPDRTILLDAGDSWYGSAIALLTQGKAPLEVMNAMGYEAMTMHWEFNLGSEALLARIGEANFPVMAQNLVDTDFEDRVLSTNSLVKDFGDVRVAVVGQAYPFSLLTTELRDANPNWRMGYREDTLQAEIDRVRAEEGATVVVLLSHMGLEQDKVMAGLLSGVDVIVGSHTHDILWQPERVGGTVIVQAGSHGKLLGELDLEIRSGKVDGVQHRPLPVLADRIEPDPDISALIDRLYQPHRDRLQRVVGETESLLYRRSTFGGTTDAFMAEAYRQIVGADVGCAPGWRFGATLLPGPITVEDVYNAMKPTASPLYTASLTGRQMRASLEDNLDNVFNSDPLQRLGGDVLRCAGVQAQLRRAAPREERLSNIVVNGEPWAEDRRYQVATSGGRTQYQDENVEATPQPSVEALIAFIEAQSPIRSDAPVQAFAEAG
jgi:sulfur-oxidizing protein SoxB